MCLERVIHFFLIAATPFTFLCISEWLFGSSSCPVQEVMSFSMESLLLRSNSLSPDYDELFRILIGFGVQRSSTERMNTGESRGARKGVEEKQKKRKKRKKAMDEEDDDDDDDDFC